MVCPKRQGCRRRSPFAFVLLIVVVVAVAFIMTVDVSGSGARRFPRKLNVRRDAYYHSLAQMNMYEKARFGYARPRGMPHKNQMPYDHEESQHSAYTCDSPPAPPPAYPTELGEPDGEYGDEECFRFAGLPSNFTIEPGDSDTACEYQFYKVTPEESTSGENVCDYICSNDNFHNCRAQYRDRYMSIPVCQCTRTEKPTTPPPTEDELEEKFNVLQIIQHTANCSNTESQVTSMFGIVNGHLPLFLQAVTTDIDQHSRPRLSPGSSYCVSYGEYMGDKCNAICKNTTDDAGNFYGGGYHLRLPVSDNSCKDLPYFVLEACVCSCQYIIDERIQCRG